MMQLLPTSRSAVLLPLKALSRRRSILTISSNVVAHGTSSRQQQRRFLHHILHQNHYWFRCHSQYQYQIHHPSSVAFLPSPVEQRQLSSSSTVVRKNKIENYNREENSEGEDRDGISNDAGIPLMERSKKSIFQQFYDKYSVSQQTNRILIAESLFQAAVSQASKSLWYGSGRIPGNEFRPYQALVTMHVWFLHKRLLKCQDDSHKAALIQEELFDILWIDSSNRMRAHGVQEMLIHKHLKTVQQYTFLHMFHYDHCYTGELLHNPKDRLDELKKLIKTHILLLPTLPGDDENENDDDGTATEVVVDPVEYDKILQLHMHHDDQAERIAWYVETQYQNIVHDLPESFFEKARIAWVDLPSFDRMVDDKGKVLPEPEATTDKSALHEPLPSGWVRNIANDGTYYYWNISTRESQWEMPTSVK